MTLQNVFTLLILAVPAATFALGLLCWRYPPQGPTWAFGYRSRRARASDASWLFAQSLAGPIWFCLGLVLVLVCLPMSRKMVELPLEDLIPRAITMILVQDLLVLLSMLPTELLLLQKFDRFGRPRRKAKLQPEDAYDPAEDEPMAPVPEAVEEFTPTENAAPAYRDEFTE